MIYIMSPEKKSYIKWCWGCLIERLGAKIFWDKSYPCPYPVVRYWMKEFKRTSNQIRQRLELFLRFYLVALWKQYNSNRGRHRNINSLSIHTSSKVLMLFNGSISYTLQLAVK